MIKRLGFFMLICLFISPVSIAISNEGGELLSARQSCQNWAEEDGISQKEMEDFITSCVEEIQKIDEEQNAEVSDESQNKESMQANPE
ncbi:MAG: hypothetical protein HQL68_10945 [Magnetococcales bacterium]|nr:hypothetical protein [Magnetococcales bacterium]